jgi:ferredoxin-NADP reductase
MAVPQKLRCQIEQIIDHGDHVYSVELRPERPVPRFRPGQFLHLALDAYDPSGFWPESRVFSIANSPAQRDRLRISYSVRGRFTARMERELKEGRWAWVKMPYGDFVIDGASDVVLFAGGTGITAFTAFLDGLTPQFRNTVYLAYGARSKNLLIYLEKIQAWACNIPEFHRFYFIENLPDGPLLKENEDQAKEIIGVLSVESVWEEIRAPEKATYYISGPPGMIQTIGGDLRNRGIHPTAIRIDAWE